MFENGYMAVKEIKGSLLVVEDEENLREALKLNLELEGYNVSTLDNGPAVLKAVKNEYFDLIILDIMLPDMDGLDVCRQSYSYRRRHLYVASC